MIDRIERAGSASAGRSAGTETPTPPTPPPPIGERSRAWFTATSSLPELFVKRAASLKMLVTQVASRKSAAEMVKFVRCQPRIRKVALSVTPLLDGSRCREALAAGGFDVRTWDEMTPDEPYDFDCA